MLAEPAPSVKELGSIGTQSSSSRSSKPRQRANSTQEHNAPTLDKPQKQVQFKEQLPEDEDAGPKQGEKTPSIKQGEPTPSIKQAEKT